MTGTCQCSDSTYKFKITFPCISETKEIFVLNYFQTKEFKISEPAIEKFAFLSETEVYSGKWS